MKMIPKRPKLNESFPDWLTGGGIFSALAELEIDLPWQDSPDILDIDYHGGHSGEKLDSPIVTALSTRDMEGEYEPLSEETRQTLARIIWTQYGTAWTRIFNALVTEYLPLENYNMTEHEDIDKDETRTPNLTNETTISNEVSTRETGVYGVNSVEAVPSETSTVTRGGTGTAKTTGTEEVVNDDERTLTRHGNIGVTTSQQMLQSEIDLRKSAIFYDIVFADIDKVLTLPIY